MPARTGELIGSYATANLVNVAAKTWVVSFPGGEPGPFHRKEDILVQRTVDRKAGTIVLTCRRAGLLKPKKKRKDDSGNVVAVARRTCASYKVHCYVSYAPYA
jgi:hypothetical protein